jgi:multiple sugar transport system permease protein
MLAPTFLVVISVVLFPLLWNVWMSFKPLTLEGLRGDGLLSPTWTLDNYRKVLWDPEFGSVLLTTLLYTTAGSLLSILLGLAAAMMVHRPFPGRSLVRGLLLSPYIAPVVAVTFTWSFLLDPQLGLVNALGLRLGLFTQPIPFLSQRWWNLHLWGVELRVPLALTWVTLFEGWRYFPFAFLFILARLQAIPQVLEWAARVDGATPLQRFRHVTLPQLLPVLSALFLFRFIWTFNKFDDIFLLTRGQAGTKVLTVKVYEWAFGEFDIGASSAAAMLLFGVLGVFLILYFRWMTRQGE